MKGLTLAIKVTTYAILLAGLLCPASGRQLGGGVRMKTDCKGALYFEVLAKADRGNLGVTIKPGSSSQVTIDTHYPCMRPSDLALDNSNTEKFSYWFVNDNEHEPVYADGRGRLGSNWPVSDDSCVAPGLPKYALIARFEGPGHKGKWFLIGRSGTFKAPDWAQHIRYMCNGQADSFATNRGSIKVYETFHN